MAGITFHSKPWKPVHQRIKQQNYQSIIFQSSFIFNAKYFHLDEKFKQLGLLIVIENMVQYSKLIGVAVKQLVQLLCRH